MLHISGTAQAGGGERVTSARAACTSAEEFSTATTATNTRTLVNPEDIAAMRPGHSSRGGHQGLSGALGIQISANCPRGDGGGCWGIRPDAVQGRMGWMGFCTAAPAPRCLTPEAAPTPRWSLSAVPRRSQSETRRLRTALPMRSPTRPRHVSLHVPSGVCGLPCGYVHHD